MPHTFVKTARFKVSLTQICHLVLIPLSLSLGLLQPLTGVADVHVSERVFNFRIRAEPETLDWHKAHTPIESHLLMNIMEGLVAYDGLKVVPSLASHWRVSPDGKTYIFSLRPGIKWSDGVPLRAKDFVYGWKRLLSPLTAASYADLLFDVAGAEDFHNGKISDFSLVGIKAPNDSTVVVTLKHPLAYWIHIPAFWATFPLRQDIIETYGDEWTSPGSMVGLGPYTLISHDIDTSFMLKANAFYSGERGNVDKINVYVVKDDQKAFEMYQSGALDFLSDLTSMDLKQVKNHLIVFPHLMTEYLGFVTTKSPASNLHVRRAIAMAIDKKALVSELFGKQIPATTFIPKPLLGSREQLAPGLPYDLKRAQHELRSSGLHEPGKPLKMKFILPNWKKVSQVAKILQKQLKANLDIDLELEPMDNQTFRTQVDLHAKPLFYGTWTADFPDPDNFMSVFQSETGNNRTTWKNADFDHLLKVARLSLNTNERTTLYARLQRLLLEDQAVIVPLFYEQHLALIRNGVSGIRLNQMDYLYLKNLKISY